jgi:hypothetical protein
MPNKSGPGGQRRLIFTGNVKTSLFNKYTPGAGVGGMNSSVRRALNRRANSAAGTLGPNGTIINNTQCCNPTTYTKQ